MIDILPDICYTAQERFGKDTQLSLEVYHDPEIRDEYLTLYARQERYSAGVLDLITSVSSQYATALGRKSGRLLVTTDFRPLR